MNRDMIRVWCPCNWLCFDCALRLIHVSYRSWAQLEAEWKTGLDVFLRYGWSLTKWRNNKIYGWFLFHNPSPLHEPMPSTAEILFQVALCTRVLSHSSRLLPQYKVPGPSCKFVRLHCPEVVLVGLIHHCNSYILVAKLLRVWNDLSTFPFNVAMFDPI